MEDKIKYGVDVSGWQRKTNWDAVASFENPEISFAFVKSTEGTGYVNPYYELDMQGLANTDIPVGAYHYFHGAISGAKQAEYMLKTVDVEKLQLPVVLDFEDYNGLNQGLVSAQTMSNRGLDFMRYMKRFAGITPIIYTGAWIFNYMPSNDGLLEWLEYPLWVASYRLDRLPIRFDNPVLPDLWKWRKFTHPFYIHQYSSRATVAGINTNVDINWAFEHRINKLRLDEVVEPDPPTPEPDPNADYNKVIDEVIGVLEKMKK